MKSSLQNKQDLAASTLNIDHFHTIVQLKEKFREYNIPPCIPFVDYEKEFDSKQY